MSGSLFFQLFVVKEFFLKNKKDIMQLFSTDTTIFLKEFSKLFWPQKVEKNTLKSCSEKLKSTIFFLTAWAAQMAQTEEFMFQNVAYRPTVY